MERNDNICPQTSNQTINQAEISITEAHSNPLWSVDRRGAGQYTVLYCTVMYGAKTSGFILGTFIVDLSQLIFLKLLPEETEEDEERN